MACNDKLLSGRLWLTIITGIVFAYAVFSKILGAEAVSAIIATVFTSYFNKNNEQQQNGGAK